MPAWGDAQHDEDSWKLALFVHHLPQQSPEEVKEMQRFNPRSPAEIEEDKAEQDFLNGTPTQDAAPKHHH